jgi:hypothetical protein
MAATTFVAPLDPVNRPAAVAEYQAARAAVQALPPTATKWEALDRLAQARRWLLAFGPCVLEPGDHVVCSCGQLHEASYCPTADGDGVAL